MRCCPRRQRIVEKWCLDEHIFRSTAELKRTPGCKCVSERYSDWKYRRRPAREEMWLVTVGIPATDYLVGASIVKNVDKKKLVKFTFTAPDEPCKMAIEVKAINLNHCYCEYATVVKDVVDEDEDTSATAGTVSDGVEDDLPSGMDTDEDENDDFVEEKNE